MGVVARPTHDGHHAEGAGDHERVGGQVEQRGPGALGGRRLDGDEDEETEALKVVIDDIDTTTVPPGGWQFQPDGDFPKISSISLSTVVHLAKAHGATKQDVMDQNVRRNYEYFFRLSHGDMYHFAEAALKAAGIQE